MKKLRTIKIYDQNVNGNDMDEEKLIQNLKDNGLTVLKYGFSQFFGYYVLKVKGVYTGNVQIYNT